MTSSEHETAPQAPGARLAYLDVLRGVAVAIMVLAHVVDSWTRAADRVDSPYYTAIFVGGLGAPLFLFLAGVAQVMSANGKVRRAGDRDAGMQAIWRRGWEVFALALLFRLQSQLLGWGALRNLFKVDILNVMGLAIVATAIIWRLGPSRTGRIGLFVLATAATAFAAPVIRALSPLEALPDPIEAYLRPAGPYSTFTLFPWAAFLFAGAVIGELVDALRPFDKLRVAPSGVEGRLASDPARSGQAAALRASLRLQLSLAVAGALGIVLGWWASLQPSIYTTSEFWTSSPAFFFIRLGIITVAVPATWAHCVFWLQRARAWAPGVAITRAVEQLGRSSLFVYWIHVEMVYGVIAEPIKGTLPLWGSLIATLALCVALYYIVCWKNQRMKGVHLPPLFAAVLR